MNKRENKRQSLFIEYSPDRLDRVKAPKSAENWFKLKSESKALKKQKLFKKSSRKSRKSKKLKSKEKKISRAEKKLDNNDQTLDLLSQSKKNYLKISFLKKNNVNFNSKNEKEDFQKDVLMKKFNRKNCNRKSIQNDILKFHSMKSNILKNLKNKKGNPNEKKYSNEKIVNVKDFRRQWGNYEGIVNEILNKHRKRSSFTVKPFSLSKEKNILEDSTKFWNISNKMANKNSQLSRKKKYKKSRNFKKQHRKRFQKEKARRSIDYHALQYQTKKKPQNQINSLNFRINRKSKSIQRASIGHQNDLKSFLQNESKFLQKILYNKQNKSNLQKLRQSNNLNKPFEGFENIEHHFKTRKRPVNLPRLFFKKTRERNQNIVD